MAQHRVFQFRHCINWILFLYAAAKMTYAIMTEDYELKTIERRWLMRFILNNSSQETDLKDWKEGTLQQPFWALVLFFTMFLGITYFFGFVLAFYMVKQSRLDNHTPALYTIETKINDTSSNLYYQTSDQSSAAYSNGTEKINTQEAAFSAQEQPKDKSIPHIPRTLYFETVKSDLQCSSEAVKDIEDKKKLRQEYPDLCGLSSTLKLEEYGKDDWDPKNLESRKLRRKTRNYISIDSVVKENHSRRM